MLQITTCKFKCKGFRNDSNICTCYTSLCSDYRKLLYWYRRLEIVRNQIEGYEKRLKYGGGLNANDTYSFNLLENEAIRLEQHIEGLGVKH